MKPKDMRVKLKEAGITCPVSNKDVIERYNANFGEKKTIEDAPKFEGIQVEAVNLDTGDIIPTIVELVSDNIYTYVGSGCTPPERTNFMGLQEFVRGEPIEVVDPFVRKKIENHPCFIKGTPSLTKMRENDERELEGEMKRKRAAEAQLAARRTG